MSLEAPRANNPENRVENSGEEALRLAVTDFLKTLDTKLSVTKVFTVEADQRDYNEAEPARIIVHIDHAEHPTQGVVVRFQNMQQLEKEVKGWYNSLVKPTEEPEEYRKAA